MKIEIKLKNYKYCNGCMLLRFGGFGIGAYCMYHKKENAQEENLCWESEEDGKVKRPEICIINNGR